MDWSKFNWTKFLVGLVSALIVALQGVNITQGIAIASTESRIEHLEEDLGKANYGLNVRIAANQDEFRARWLAADKKLDEIMAKLNQKSSN